MTEHLRRDWETPVHASTTRARDLFGIDPRLVAVPLVFPITTMLILAALMGDALQVVKLALIGVVVYGLAKAQWEISPYLINDFLVELQMPKRLSDGAGK